ncbi:hypothetical protein [Desulfoplanes formicivorans]|uniref:hypothetical protein n=1 Tax=Desulfoplanes formicivorans TaxID=1592317 RepID=UPI00114D1510|nr:hypothetical protein [Desulfoplanes formicivorans]
MTMVVPPDLSILHTVLFFHCGGQGQAYPSGNKHARKPGLTKMNDRYEHLITELKITLYENEHFCIARRLGAKSRVCR